MVVAEAEQNPPRAVSTAGTTSTSRPVITARDSRDRRAVRKRASSVGREPTHHNGRRPASLPPLASWALPSGIEFRTHDRPIHLSREFLIGPSRHAHLGRPTARGHSSAVPRRSGNHRRPDADTGRRTNPWILYVGLASAIVVPTSLAIPGPLRGHGTLPRLLGVLAFALVISHWLYAGKLTTPGAAHEAPEWRRVRSSLLLFLTFLCAFGLLAQIGQAPASAQSMTMRTITLLLAVVGFTYYARFCLDSPRRIFSLLYVLVAAGSLNGLVGAAQTFARLDWIALLDRLGLAVTVGSGDALTRGDFLRVVGTTVQPIEFSVVSACLIPFAVYLSFHGPSLGGRAAGALGALIMLATLPLSVSRGGLLITAVGLMIMLFGLAPKQRIKALAAAVPLAGLTSLAMPGLAATIIESVTTAGEDSSIRGRLQDYPAVMESVSGNLFFGRAIHLRGMILDNQWLGLLVLTGLFGVALYAAVFVTTLVAASVVPWRDDMPAPHSLNAAFIAISTSGILANAFLDTFSFQGAFVATMLPVILSGCSRRTSSPSAPT